MERLQGHFEGLQNHPFTDIQLSDKEKFHTGMLKLLLDVFKDLELEHGLWEVRSKDFSKFEYVLEEDSIDLYAKEGGEETIVESKFKSGLHLSKVRVKKEKKEVSQLAKYVKSRPKAKKGVVVSLFSEQAKDLNVKDWLLELEVESQIKEFKNIQFIKEVRIRLNYLLSLIGSEESVKSMTKIQRLDEGKISLLKLWNSYLGHLEKLVDYFEEHQDLRAIRDSDDFEASIKKIKLKGVFERQRMLKIQQKVKDRIEEGEVSLIELLKYHGKDYKSIGEIYNTRGNSGLHFTIDPLVKHKYLLDFGLQWQADSLKFFIEQKIGSKKNFEASRKIALKKWGEKLKNHVQSKSQIGNPRSGKLSSVSIMKPKVFGAMESFPEKLVLCLRFLKDNRKNIIKDLDTLEKILSFLKAINGYREGDTVGCLTSKWSPLPSKRSGKRRWLNGGVETLIEGTERAHYVEFVSEREVIYQSVFAVGNSGHSTACVYCLDSNSWVIKETLQQLIR